MSATDAMKARVSPGNAVSFVYKNSQVSGRVVSLGRKCATVHALHGQQYRVPYAQLQLQDDAKDYSGIEDRALARCRELMRRHGLDPAQWVARLDDSRSRAGACNFRDKVISLSRLYVRAASTGELDDTILHEIAHALVGPQHHHDAVWRAQARAIGCSGDRCHSLKFSPPRWMAACVAGCFTRPAQRRRRNVVCRRCGGQIVWRAWDGKTEQATAPSKAPRSNPEPATARHRAVRLQGAFDFPLR